MSSQLFDNLLYIFEAAIILTISLAIIGVYAFYLAISVWIKLSSTKENLMIESCTRKISTLKVLAFSAPMLGLLGTVIGIGKCVASADNSQSLADGISYALLTTQTGLIMAIPAWIAAIILSKKLGEIKLLSEEKQK